jgi:predicted dienelactone hydrolase
MVEVLELRDTSRPDWRGPGPRPVRTYLWRAEAGGPGPLVLMSHSIGGTAEELDWLAGALVSAGFTVACAEHHGDNGLDGCLPEGLAFVWERPRDLSFVLDRLAADGTVDPHRVGAAGFSLGGYAAVALLGARLDARVLEGIAQGVVAGRPQRSSPLPDIPNLAEDLRTRHAGSSVDEIVAAGARSHADPRVRAAFLIAPAIGAMTDPASLAGIDRPVALRWGDADDEVPPEQNALRYWRSIPGVDGRSLGADVGHFVFLGDEPDPKGVRAEVAAEAVAFFHERL